ncbi:MAG: SLC13/DASS family transporter [Marinilabiliaceae bacterium]|nr:SLC13/DASS family transporter [Marinilabiliaceae bacterium]
MDKSKVIKIAIAVILSLLAWLAPADVFGIPGLTVIEQRIIAIFIFAALMWIFEAIPIWTTSVLIMAILLLTVSDSMFAPFIGEGESFGLAISHKSILSAWADPIVMLFMGGFALAIAATSTGLDLNIARVMLKPFGTKSEMILMGFMLVTAVLSMFMSNTATSAMMLAIVAPVIRLLPPEGKGRTAIVMAVPIAANVGGIGTPIGTPPNAIALRYLNQAMPDSEIGFGQWMMVMIPFVIVLLAISWFLLLKFFPFTQKTIELKIDGEFRKDKKAIIVYVTFAVTVLLWLCDKFTHINANIVAFIPLTVFCVTGIIGVRELKEINWDVLWLVAGGFALGVGLDKSGLANHIIEAIPFDSWEPWVVVAAGGLICYSMSTFMSNTASAALLVPILTTIAIGMGDSLKSLGGPITMLLGIAISASLAMALPISTPPNALAHATGHIKQSEMAKVGIIVGLVGLVLGYALLIFVTQVGIF